LTLRIDRFGAATAIKKLASVTAST